MSTIKYRADIDGLRAIAVLSVFLFHLNNTILPGGFLGVDIFFVISGYLITLILLRELSERGKISIKEFYRKRIKRILPSFYLILVVSLVASLLLLMPKDLVIFAKTIKAAIQLQSNVYFGSINSYFSIESDEFPLLHTWSLSIEEQFYFLWPIVLSYLFRIVNPKTKVFILFSLIIFLLGLGQYYSGSSSTSQWSYFFSLTRFAEILIGCTAAYQVHLSLLLPRENKVQSGLMFAGLILILSSMLIISKSSVYPGYLSLLPCLGAYLFLVTGALSTTPLHKFFGHSIFGWFGLHSYAIYLWHWCILAFYRYWSGYGNLGIRDSLIIVVATFLVSFLSRKFVEVPFNNSKRSFRFILVLFFILPLIGFLRVSKIIRKSDGLPGRVENYSAFVKESTFTESKHCHNTEGRICQFGNPQGQKVLLFGDSISGYYAPVLLKTIIGMDKSFHTISSARCGPLLTQNADAFYVDRLDVKQCTKTLQSVRDFLKNNKVEMIVIAGKWSNLVRMAGFETKFNESLQFLHTQSSKVFILGTLPYYDSRALDHLRRKKYSPLSHMLKSELQNQDLIIPRDVKDSWRLEGNVDVQRIVKTLGIGEYLDIDAMIGKTSIQLPINEGKAMYSDGYHLNDFGAEMVGEAISEDLKKTVF